MDKYSSMCDKSISSRFRDFKLPKFRFFFLLTIWITATLHVGQHVLFNCPTPLGGIRKRRPRFPGKFEYSAFPQNMWHGCPVRVIWDHGTIGQFPELKPNRRDWCSIVLDVVGDTQKGLNIFQVRETCSISWFVEPGPLPAARLPCALEVRLGMFRGDGRHLVATLIRVSPVKPDRTIGPGASTRTCALRARNVIALAVRESGTPWQARIVQLHAGIVESPFVPVRWYIRTMKLVAAASNMMNGRSIANWLTWRERRRALLIVLCRECTGKDLWIEMVTRSHHIRSFSSCHPWCHWSELDTWRHSPWLRSRQSPPGPRRSSSGTPGCHWPQFV